VAWLIAISVVFASIMVLFGQPEAYGVGLAVLAFAIGLPLGQGIRGLMGKNASGDKSAKPAPEPEAA
jgi:hypothetical protein